MTTRLLIFALTLWGMTVPHKSCEGAVIYLYDFPGNSGLAASQTNSQPTFATFSDFTRTNLNSASGSGEFGSANWNQTGTIDTTQHEGFSITASPWYVLNLSSLTFDALRSNTGPQNMEVDLFLNGSATAYATFSFSPTQTKDPYTFNFTPLTDTDMVTSATFVFYGWNATGVGGQLYLDNVATNGVVSALPEYDTSLFVLLPIVAAIFSLRRSVRQIPGEAPG
jgi:hypothetical protein